MSGAEGAGHGSGAPPVSYAILERDTGEPWEWSGLSADTPEEAREVIARLRWERGAWGQQPRTDYRFEACDDNGDCPFLARQHASRINAFFRRIAA